LILLDRIKKIHALSPKLIGTKNGGPTWDLGAEVEHLFTEAIREVLPSVTPVFAAS
jgi:hypothetical protein